MRTGGRLISHRPALNYRFRVPGIALTLIAAAVACFAPARPAAADPSGQVRDILAACPDHFGLWIHLGCGQADSPALTAELAAGGQMLVNGLALDDAALARAREAIQSADMAGRAMAEKLERQPAGPALPYLPDLARAVIVQDMAAVEAAGITPQEIQRVLAPGGVLCVQADGKWKATVKPRPAGMDEWAQQQHGPDGNMASGERTIAFPIDLRWIDGVPFGRGGFASNASCRAIVLAGGRCFSISIDDVANLATGRPDAWLLARDAWSGLPLWKVNCEGTWGKVELDWRNIWPLVATDKRVYVARKSDVAILDAATGDVLVACPTKYQVRRMLLADGCLVAGCWEKLGFSNVKDGFENDAIRTVWWPAGEGSVEAFDPATGKPKWNLPLTPLTMVAGDGLLYVLTQDANPPTRRELTAIDLATGQKKWSVGQTTFGEDPDVALNFAGPGCVVLSLSRAKAKREVTVLSASDGSVLHKLPGTTARALVDGQLWCVDGRYDLKTGQKVPGDGIGPTYAGTNVVGGCVAPIVVGDQYVTASRGGVYVKLPDSPGSKPEKLSYQGARGTCILGMLPANGMFYTAQNNCNCYSAQVGGFLAVGPFDPLPTAEDFDKARPVEKGPAFDQSAPATDGGDDWPTYRHDTERSGGTSADMPAKLKELWRVQCAAPGKGTFGEAWNARIGAPQPLTAPIVAGGKVFVAALDNGQVMALDAATGQSAWKVLLASRIDTPPTCYQGLLLVGCHDGWVYALRAADGQLAYRVRIAPLERRMIAHGAVESPWPATGTVLVHDGLAYATAGRTTMALGGIALVAFKPLTGQTVWTRQFGDKLRFLSDVLVMRDGELAWHWMRMDPKTGKDLPPAQKFIGSAGMLDGSWTTGFSKSGRGFMLGRVCEGMMAWNRKLVVVPGWAVSRDKAETPKPPATAGPKHPDRFKKEELAWQTNLEPHIEWARVWAMTVTGNAAYFAGGVFNGWANGRYDGSFVWVKSAADGKALQPPIKLDAAPSYDAMAVSGGRLYLALRDGTLLCLGE
ncbi:MAG: Outer membrane protein assembly factor BamB [Phycisphaerae bacterium]|nr:Outer membrane protein assembly factor BamB [Phycisphaerae bacterium]